MNISMLSSLTYVLWTQVNIFLI